MLKWSLILLLFSTVWVTGCEQPDVQTHADMEIISGQSFGFCIGPCFQTVTISSLSPEVRFIVRTTEIRGQQAEATELNYADNIAENEWSEILKIVKESGFFYLQDVYGCPDCADGGAEFIEIRQGDKIKRVTFEYGKSVKEIDKLIPLLRKIRTELSAKYVK